MTRLWKRCTKCGTERAITEFYKASGCVDGLRGDCIPCFSAARKWRTAQDPQHNRDRVRKWQAENPERYRERQDEYRADGKKKISDRKSHLKRKYDLTPEEYDEMLAAQDGGCAICREPPRDGVALHVDHDHRTGLIRGLLCFGCNSALGRFDDDAERLLLAYEYLERGPTTADVRQLIGE